MKHFGKFVESPYFHSGRNLVPLYSILKKEHPEFPSEKISEEKIYCKLQPKEKFNQKKSSLILRVMFSEMTKLARKFIVYEMFETGKLDFDFNNALVSGLGNKRLLKDSHKILLENSVILDKSEKNTSYFSNRLKTNMLLTISLKEIENNTERADYEKNNLLYIYAFMFQHITAYIHTARARQHNHNINFTGLGLIKSFIDGFNPEVYKSEVSDDSFETKNITLFYYYVLKSRFDESDKASLLTGMEIYIKMFPNLPYMLRYNYFLNLHNRFEVRLHMDRIYLKKANELSDFVFKEKIFSYRKNLYMDNYFYERTLGHKAALLNAKKLLDYIKTYVEETAPENREDLRAYSMSYVYFKKKLYDKCLENISKNDSLDNFFKINKYKLKLCSLYELKLFEDVLYAVDSFEHFIRRKENVGPQIRKDSMEFIKGVKNLIELKMGKGNNINPDEIKEINKNTLFGDWLGEKVKELAGA